MRILIHFARHPDPEPQLLPALRQVLALAGIDRDADIRVCADPALLAAIGVDTEDQRLLSVETRLHGVDTGDAIATDDAIVRLHARFAFDVLVGWGNDPAARRAADRVGALASSLRPAALGSAYRPMLALDPAGPDGTALAARLDIDDLTVITGGHGLEADEARFCAADPGTDGAAARFRPPVTGPWPAPPDRLRAFLPLPPPGTLVRVGVPGLETLSAVVRAVVPQLVLGGYDVIVRPPALSVTGDAAQDAALQREIAAARGVLRDLAGAVTWRDPARGALDDDEALIARSDIVVAPLGEAGLSAVLQDKPLVHVGPSDHAIQGLFPTLDMVLSGGFDRIAYVGGLGLLRRWLFDGGLVTLDDLAVRARMIDRIATLAAADPAATPRALARLMWQGMAPVLRHHRLDRVLAPRAPDGTVAAPAQPPAPPDPRADSSDAPWVAVPGLAIAAVPQLFRRIAMLAAADDTAGIPDGPDGPDVAVWLDSLWADPPRLRRVLLDLGLFDKGFYRREHAAHLAPGDDPLSHFTGAGEAAHLAPSPAVSLAAYVAACGGISAGPARAAPIADQPLREMLWDVVTANRDHAAADVSLDPDEAAALEALHTIDPVPARFGSDPHVVVLADLARADLAASLLEALDALPRPVDLMVTLPLWGADAIRAVVRARHPQAQLFPCPARGGDIGPLLAMLPALAARAPDLVLRVQTLRGLPRGETAEMRHGDALREIALRALLGSPAVVAAALGAFAADPDLGLVVPAPLLVLTDDGGDDTGGNAHVAGGMFWVRPTVLARLAQTGIAPQHLRPTLDGPDPRAATIARRIVQGAGRIAGLDPVSAVPAPVMVAPRSMADLEGYLAHWAAQARGPAGAA